MISNSLLKGIVPDIICSRFSSARWNRESIPVPREMALTIYLDSKELITLPCTPTKLTELVFGALFLRGIITDKNDVTSIHVDEEGSVANVKLKKPGNTSPALRTLALRRASAVAFTSQRQVVNSNLKVSPTHVLSMMKQLNESAEIYRFSGGVHTSALGDGKNLMLVAEDISRHSTVDKIIGECLLMEIPTKDKILLTTGRISSETLRKTILTEIPIVVSRGSPTDYAISLAKELGITLIGYARSKRLSVYSHQERLKGALENH